MATTSRMLVLLSLLQARRDWPGQALARRLDISERTVRRDVERLRDLGYRIHAIKGPDGGYRLDAGSELPPLLFDDDQAIVLALALQTVALPGTGLEEAAARALTTVRQVMPSRLRHRIDAVRITAIAEGVPVDPAVIVTLSAAIHASETVRFDYAGEPRRAEPNALVTRGGRWYLVAWDLDRDDWRTFRVDRLTPRTPSGPRFRPRELPDVAAFVEARFKGSSGDNVWPCQGEAVISLPAAEVVPYVSDGTVEVLAPNRCRVILGSWSWVALAARFGQFDAELADVHPAELGDAFAVLARRYGANAAASWPEGR